MTGVWMRAALTGLVAAALGAAACKPSYMPKRSVSAQVAKDHPNVGALWPILLQHCMRQASCDPMSKFGEGGGQASGIVGSTTYFVETAEMVGEGGEDYGGAVVLSLTADRGRGGQAGRPATQDELPANLRLPKSRRSILWIEYRTPSGAAEPYFLSFMSAQLALGVSGASAAKSQEEIMQITSDYLDSLIWPGANETGAKVEIIGEAGVLLTGYSAGIPSAQAVTKAQAMRRGFEPWMFHMSRNIRDEPVDGLLKAIAAGETLSLKLTTPDGRVMLSDTFYTDGYSAALDEGMAALADPLIASPLTDRCVPFVDKGDGIWAAADVSAGLKTCDARTAQQRAEALGIGR